MAKQYTDLSGQKFNRLTVIKLDHKKQLYDKQGKPNGNIYYYLGKCDCGNETVVCATSLVRGTTKSCGCLTKEKLVKYNKENKVKHGYQKTRLYREWCSMKGRCYYPSVNGYKNYGGRGIIVCEEWKNNFVNFKDWAVSHGYSDNLSLDRIDVNGNYEPDNCRWVTLKEQSHNTRTNHYITYRGETHCLSEWAEILGIGRHTLFNRIVRRKWDIERAFTEPINENKRRYGCQKK